MPSNIDLIDLKEYILFSTSDRNNSIIHKKTGVVILKKYFEFIIAPFSVGNNICFVTKDFFYICNHEVKELKKIKNIFDNIDNAYFYNNTFLIISKNKIYKCNEEFKYEENDVFDNFNKYYDAIYLSNDKKVLKISESDTDIFDKENNILFFYNNFKVFNENGTIFIKYKEKEVIDSVVSDIRNIYSYDNYLLIMDKKNVINFWRVN